MSQLLRNSMQRVTAGLLLSAITIYHRSGKSNQDADGLSRRPYNLQIFPEAVKAVCQAAQIDQKFCNLLRVLSLQIMDNQVKSYLKQNHKSCPHSAGNKSNMMIQLFVGSRFYLNQIARQILIGYSKIQKIWREKSSVSQCSLGNIIYQLPLDTSFSVALQAQRMNIQGNSYNSQNLLRLKFSIDQGNVKEMPIPRSE